MRTGAGDWQMRIISLLAHIRNFLLSPFLHSENPARRCCETEAASGREMNDLLPDAPGMTKAAGRTA